MLGNCLNFDCDHKKYLIKTHVKLKHLKPLNGFGTLRKRGQKTYRIYRNRECALPLCILENSEKTPVNPHQHDFLDVSQTQTN